MLLRTDLRKRQVIDRPMSLLTAIGGCILLLDQTVFRLDEARQFATWWNLLGAIVVVGLLALALGSMKLPIAVLRTLWLLLPAVYLVAQASWVFAFTGTDLDAAYPWVWTLDAAVITMLLFTLRPVPAVLFALGLSMAPVLSALLVLGRVPTAVWLDAPSQSGNAVYVVIFIALRRELLRLQAGEAEARRLRRRQVRAEAVLAQQTALERLVHDEVLSVLSAAIHASETPSPALQRHARLALDALGGALEDSRSGTQLDAPDAARLISDQLRQVDPYCPVRAEGTLGEFPYDAVAALGRAAAEALRNSLRHAGPAASRHVAITADADGLQVSVRDDGVGFAMEAASSRVGIARSIHGRMSEAGGLAEISSAAGQGTEVTLTWPM